MHNPLEGTKPELTLDLHDGSDEQISIVIVHKDRPEYLSILLNSITMCSVNSNYEIIVVDNASGKESQSFLDEISDGVKVIRNEKNLYWGPAANKGMMAVDRNSKYIIFMHCDVVVLNPNWMDLLINVSESSGSGMVGVELQTYFIAGQKVDFVQEWCMLLTRDCWNDVGSSFPEELPQVGGNFIMTMRAQQKGHKPQVLKNPIVHHYRIFAMSISEWEVQVDISQANLPRLMREMQMASI